MPSEETEAMVDPPADPATRPEASVGRTAWDFLFGSRWTIVGVIAAASAIGIVAYLACTFPEQVLGYLRSYWAMALAPPVAYYLGGMVAERHNAVRFRYVLIVNPVDHGVHVVSIPEALYGSYNQTGNNVVYHSSNGTPTYLARDIDFDSNRIDYGWIHESDAAIVMTCEDAYVKWRDVTETVLRENLQLSHNPHIIGLGYARTSLKEQLDMIAEMLGFTKPDYRGRDVSGIDETEGYDGD